MRHPVLEAPADGQRLGGIVAEKNRSREAERELAHLLVNVLLLAGPQGLQALLHDIHHNGVITLHCCARKRRRHQLPLLSMFRAGHARETVANPALRGILRPAQEQTRRPKCGRIAKDLPISFRPDRHDMKFSGLAESNWSQTNERSVTLIEVAHSSDRIGEQTDVLARRGHSRKRRFLCSGISYVGVFRNFTAVTFARAIRRGRLSPARSRTS